MQTHVEVIVHSWPTNYCKTPARMSEGHHFRGRNTWAQGILRQLALLTNPPSKHLVQYRHPLKIVNCDLELHGRQLKKHNLSAPSPNPLSHTSRPKRRNNTKRTSCNRTLARRTLTDQDRSNQPGYKCSTEESCQHWWSTAPHDERVRTQDSIVTNRALSRSPPRTKRVFGPYTRLKNNDRRRHSMACPSKEKASNWLRPGLEIVAISIHGSMPRITRPAFEAISLIQPVSLTSFI